MAGRPRLLTRPPRVDHLMARPRLVEAVGERRVVVLTGPPGSGCTTAAAQVAAADVEQRGSRLAWCRLAPAFDRAADVIDMVMDALGAGPSGGRRVLDLADRLLDQFDLGPLTVVIDDHHLGSDGDIDRLIAECVGLTGADARFIVSSASRPAGLIGLVPPPDLCLLDAADLALTDDEAGALFVRCGSSVDDANRWNRHLGGWVQGVAAGAHTPHSDPSEHVATMLSALELADQWPAMLDACAALEYVTGALLGHLGVEVSGKELSDFVAGTPLLTDNGGYVRLVGAAREARLAHLDPERVGQLRRTAGTVLATDDPTTAIDLLLSAGEFDLAADVLADHLSEIGVERALNWLYRLPAELRRRFPPVLAAGQATVEVDVALAAAQDRVEAAGTERSRREALFALGSIEAHRGELAAAASAFEAALRSARDDVEGAARISAELAAARWLLGDELGARAALEHVPATPSTRWLTAQLDAVAGNLSGAAGDIDSARDDPMLDAARALEAMCSGDDVLAARHASAAYRRAIDGGGDAFVASSVVHAWSMLRAHDRDGALRVAEEMERRVGPGHQLARVHGAIIRERCSRPGRSGDPGGTDRRDLDSPDGRRDSGDFGDHERNQRRLRDLRARGYASIERLAAAALGDDTDAKTTNTIEVHILGQHRVDCDGRTIQRGAWKSKKALDVLSVLASYGPTGARREQVVEHVWPGRDPDKGRTLLRTALSDIRRVLEPGRPPGEPSRFVTAADDLLVLDGLLDIDRVESVLDSEPTASFAELRRGIAPAIAAAEWAQEWVSRVERLIVRSAALVADDAERPQRIEALETLITAEPWHRRHYDRLAELHRTAGDTAMADDVERRWFTDD